MRALVYVGPRSMHVRDLPIPVVGDDDVLIQVKCSGICGSELSGYLGRNALRKPPCVFGHEFSGVVSDLGSRVTSLYGLIKGDRVTANPLITCGHCARCLEGNQQLCEHRQLLSAALPGSHAEFVKVPARFVHKLTADLSFEMAATAEPIACAVRIAELAAVRPSDRVLIVGMGPLGLLALQVIMLQGPEEVYVVDKNRDRLKMAEGLGAVSIHSESGDVADLIKNSIDLSGVDLAVDAVGAEMTRRQCIQSVRPGGRVVFTGLHSDETLLSVNTIIRSEIRIVGSFAYSANNFATAVKLLQMRRIGLKPEWVVSGSLESGPLWHERLVNNEVSEAKVLLYPGQKGELA